MGLHLQLIAVQPDEFLVLLLIPEETVQRTLVRAGPHRDDGIDQDLEIRAEFVRGMGGDGRCLFRQDLRDVDSLGRKVTVDGEERAVLVGIGAFHADERASVSPRQAEIPPV